MILHVDFIVRSLDTALDFYCRKLGYSIVDEGVARGSIARASSNDHYDAFRFVLLRVSEFGAMIELVEFQSECASPRNSLPHPFRTGWITIIVPDLKCHVDAMSRSGIDPVSEIFTVHTERGSPCEVIFYRDPDGNGLEFMQVLLDESASSIA